MLLPVLMFGQVFHYVKAFPPLWVLSKLFPILSTPLILVLLRWPRPPAARQLAISFAWLLIVPSIIGIWTFQQSFPVGLTAQIKLLPILYFFSFLGLLRLAGPTLGEIATTFLIAAIGTFAVLIAIWLLAPQSWYSDRYSIAVTPLLTVDNRGNRIRMPMFFGLIGIFYCWRRWLGGGDGGSGWRWLPPVAIGVALLILAVRTRTTVIGVAGVMAITAFLVAGTRLRIALLALIPIAGAALFSIPYLSTVFATDHASGFDTRWITTVKAVDFLGPDPLAWIFGVGTISPLDQGGLMQYFNHFFFLADIAWLGVVFEFGLIGAAMIAALPLRGLWLARQARTANDGTRDDAFLAALQDSLLYTFLTSWLSPITLAPGEVTSIMAVMVYALARRPARTW